MSLTAIFQKDHLFQRGLPGLLWDVELTARWSLRLSRGFSRVWEGGEILGVAASAGGAGGGQWGVPALFAPRRRGA